MRPDRGKCSALRGVAGRFLRRAGWLVWQSHIGRRRAIEALLDRHSWCGDELVLDIGCGRGQATIAVARRLCSGHVVGVDLSHRIDPAGKSYLAAARAEAVGVASRVSFKRAVATALPFPDGSFDVVVSMAVPHTSSASRAQAVREALRVLSPGGTLLVFDILHARGYATMAEAAGAQHVTAPILLCALPGWSVHAEKAPT